MPRFMIATLTAQAVGGLAWWVWLCLSEDGARWFSVPSDGAPTIYRLALADLVVFVAGSAVAAVLLARESRWAAAAIWFVAGGTLYAALWCVVVAGWFGASWLGASLMLPIAAADAWIAALLSEHGPRRA